MHCADCYSENMRMRGTLSSPGWECADCGSTKPPVHAHDKLPEAEPAEPEQGPDFEDGPEFIGWAARSGEAQDALNEQYRRALDQSITCGTGSSITTGSISLAAPMSCDDCEEPTMNGVVQFDGSVTHIWCTDCAWRRGLL